MKRIKNLYLGIIMAFSIFCLVFAFYIHHHAKVIGSGIGDINGKIVGTAIGSFKGITKGIDEGSKEGEAEGLSAEDTTVEIKGLMESVGKLEVLSAGVTLKNINKIGDAYKGLYLISGDAVFTVDLNDVEISFNKDDTEVYIWIPTPELNVYLDQNSTKKLAETQKFSWSVKAEDGLIAYLNTMVQTVEKVEETMANYDLLMNRAKEAARNHVEQLTKTISTSTYIVHVAFKEGA